MQVIGNGFLAHHLRSGAASHPGVTVLAAGVSSAQNTGSSAFRREEELVRSTIQQCLERRHRLVFLSTASAGMYGAPGCRGREDDPVLPVSAFGRHKLELESVIRDSGVRALILRLGHVVGPGQRDYQLVPALARQLRAGRVVVHRHARRDLIDVGDTVVIIESLLEAGVEHEVVNVGSGESVPVDLVVSYLETRLGVTAEREYVDETGSAQPLSLEKLLRLVPRVKGMNFGPDYYRTVIDRYVDATTGT
uniref:Putative NDP-sugar 4-ketoreductase n=1 Tax=Streptomyces versipellis TaxID=67375 RepID=A0A0B6VLQ8_9ACTN|nr:putative NDP-sugar 4-ketoreductase [Streptomyces versipellis]